MTKSEVDQKWLRIVKISNEAKEFLKPENLKKWERKWQKRFDRNEKLIQSLHKKNFLVK